MALILARAAHADSLQPPSPGSLDVWLLQVSLFQTCGWVSVLIAQASDNFEL